MAKILAVINQKGGVGKTTTVMQLGVGLRARGRKVLFVDMDPQCNLTMLLAGDSSKRTILEVLTHQADAFKSIQYLDEACLIPASENLSSLGQILVKQGREYTLKDVLDPLRDDFDYIIIDSPPALGIITVNILVAADSIIIPAEASVLSQQGMSQLYSTYMTVKKYCNPELEIDGILLTRYTEKLEYDRQQRALIEEMATEMGTKVYRTTIRNSVIVKEAQSFQQSLQKYARLSSIAKDYEDFIDEYLRG